MVRLVIYASIGFFICSVMNNPEKTKEYVSTIVDFISVSGEKLKDVTSEYNNRSNNSGNGSSFN
ncbi:MAG TPA: hypothetical protein EYG69_03445 [Campylobacterales bacterium]|nr:hypothetical protein [Campylobacterales bacterium]